MCAEGSSPLSAATVCKTVEAGSNRKSEHNFLRVLNVETAVTRGRLTVTLQHSEAPLKAHAAIADLFSV